MEKAYGRINWENYPSVVTPLNEKNLNKMDSALNEVDNRVLGLDTAKLDKSTANTMVQDVSFDEATGVFTITLLDGTTKTIDTKLEKIATNFRFDYESQKLVLTLIDGSEQEVDLSTLISQYEFTDSDTIAFSVNEGKVSGIVKDGSITENKLQPNYLADVKVEVAKAENSANSSYESASVANELTQQAKQYRDEAKQFRDETENITHVSIATTETPGIVKPDGTTIRVDADGTIHADSGTMDYTELENKPTINGVELSGNKTTSDLGITASDVGADTSGSASKALEDAKAYTDSKVGETLDTYEEIMANTQNGKLAGASGVKEGFEQLNDRLIANNLGEYIDLMSYDSTTNMYVCPTDGYVYLLNQNGVNGIAGISGATSGSVYIGGVPGRFSTFVKKGMRVYVNAKPSYLRFISLY